MVVVYVRQTASLSKNSPDEPLGHGARGYEGYMIRYNSRAKRKNGSSYLKSSVGKLCFLTHLDQRLILKNVFYVGIMKNSCFYVSGSQIFSTSRTPKNICVGHGPPSQDILSRGPPETKICLFIKNVKYVFKSNVASLTTSNVKIIVLTPLKILAYLSSQCVAGVLRTCR